VLNKRISILCGNGGLFLPEEMMRGADGAMTGFAYPEMMVTVMDHHARGEGERARDLFDATLPLARFEQQPGVGIGMRKYTLAKGGIIAHDARSVDQIESWTASTPSSWTCPLSVL
jgi:4-hydroxy-tetrahydrodipicolinate synthase